MYKVKLSIATDNSGCGRQLPSGKLEWKGYQFCINDDTDEADFWVVYSKGRRKSETCSVAPENTLFITGEPDSVYHYSSGFVKQFAKVVSCQKNIRHKNIVYDQPAQPWHIGKKSKRDSQTGKEENSLTEYTQTYDSLKISNPEKSKLISIISSNKAFTKGHRERIAFVMKLKKHYGDKLDLFGWGFNNFENKWDVIAPYKYHIAIENCSLPYYWTEKLADSFLGNAFPFYYGATNVDEYFDNNAFRIINIHDAEGAIKIIDQAIEENLAENNFAYIEKAKQDVLDRYNLFNMIVEHIKGMNHNAKKELITLNADTDYFDLKKFYIMGWKRIINKISSKLS